METAATCKYYVTKLLGISPQKPNCVYDVRSGNVRNREQKSLFRVFYRSNGRRRKHRHGTANVQESYVPSTHGDEAGAKIGDRHVLEEDTVEEIEKKFQGFRNVFEKCKVKGNNKKKPRLFNVSSGLRLTLVANTMFMDSQNKANSTNQNTVTGEDATKNDDLIYEDDEDDIDDLDEADDENDKNKLDEKRDVGDQDDGDEADEDVDEVNTIKDNLDEETTLESKCPKDVADKVNSWIDSSVKQADEYSEEEESLSVYVEVNIYDYT